VFTYQLPGDFYLTPATTTFGVRNVQLHVDGIARDTASSAGVGVDGVSIAGGSGGLITYTLGSDLSIPSGAELELYIGNQTLGALGVRDVFSTTTGTTTIPADIEPIRNSTDLGLHRIPFSVQNGGKIAGADFTVFLNEKVTVTGDTTEEIPPERFGGSPTSTIAGTNLSVEISVETNEFAVCKYARTPDIAFALQPFTFDNTGLVVHTSVVTVTPNSVQEFYVRCVDDETNENIDDYLISFTVLAQPTGQSNTTGSTSGDGTGSGNDGTGSGDGGGGTSGSSDGGANTEGQTSGAGGSGGSGGGGGGGRRDGDGTGGGFENDGPYESGEGRVIISGFAPPRSEVSVLVDGFQSDRVRADADGSYEVTVDDIARGAYTFAVFATDENDEQSGVFSTTFTVSGARASELSNINITPTITITPDPVEPGETLIVSGYGLPNATVTIESGRRGSGVQKTSTALTDQTGAYRITLDTSTYARDTYQVRAKAEQVGGANTNWSQHEFFGVGQALAAGMAADLNRDGSVNLTDFSILLFWWQTDGGASDPPADINGDGNVSLTDFSILLFNWTG
jgi:hypothetical protein